MKTIDKLKVIAKVLNFISRIVFFVSIIFLVVSLVFFMIFLVAAENAGRSEIKLTGFDGAISRAEMFDLIMYFTVLILFLMKEGFISSLYNRYFSILKKSGTPFTKECAVELKKIGITTLILPFLLRILTAVLLSFASDGFFDSSILMNYNPFPSFARAAGIIYASNLCAQGYQKIKERKASL